MQENIVLISTQYSTAVTETLTLEPGFGLNNNYWSYVSNTGGGLVNDFTVRKFLDDVQNITLATNFFNYLKNTFDGPSFNELYNSNAKLANTLNDYYDRVVRAHVVPLPIVANQQLTANTEILYSNTNFIDYNTRSQDKNYVLVGLNTGNNYYVTVKIERNGLLLDNSNYDKYTVDIFGTVPEVNITTEWFRYWNVDKISKLARRKAPLYLQSFVDYAFDDSESEFWTNL